MENNLLAQKIFVGAVLLAAPAITFIFPNQKDICIAIIEATAQIILLYQLSRRLIREDKLAPHYQAERILWLSMAIAFAADCLYSLRVLEFTQDSLEYNLVVECLYGAFAISLFLAVLKGFFTLENCIRHWGWFGFFTFWASLGLSFKFIVFPYYSMPYSLILKTNSTIYAIASAGIFSLVLPFACRIIERKAYWFAQLIIFFLTADFAIRYQTSFVNVTTFSWAEFGWCSFFVGFAAIVTFSENQILMISKNIKLASFISVRNLLTLVICGANTIFLLGILVFKFYETASANDVSSILFLLFAFWLIANEFSWKIAHEFAVIVPKMFKGKEMSNLAGNKQFRLETVNEKTPLSEVSEILSAYNRLVFQTNKMIDATDISNRNAAIAKLATQVAHDIRSPLSALNLIIGGKSAIDEERRLILRDSANRINDIANNLLSQNKKTLNIVSTELLPALIESIVSEKRFEYRAKSIISIELDLNDSYGLFVSVNIGQLKRIISNLINNAVESIVGNGSIKLTFNIIDDQIELKISDTGKGIPGHIISDLGTNIKSFNKDGSGLGLSHALETLKLWGGSLKIVSQINEGTDVSIFLKRQLDPSWFVKAIDIKKNVVVVDDDHSIHGVWKQRFFNLELMHFYCEENFRSWFINNELNLQDMLFLVDFELGENFKNGLDIIKTLKIEKFSILVTSRYEDENIRKEATSIGVKILPKGMSQWVPLNKT